MKLYVDSQFTSPYAMSAYVALREAGLDFELKPLNLAAFEHHAPDFASVSLTLRVPTLDVGDFKLTESTAISEYLHETRGGCLYPTDAQERAVARQMQAWLRSDLLALRSERPTETIFLGLASKPLSAQAAAEASKLILAADRSLAGAPFLCKAWCIADVDLALMLNRLIFGNVAVPAHLCDYAKRAWDRESVRSWCSLERTLLGKA